MENNYQLSRIHNYINGLMSKEEMHALEKEALADPFLKDALEGYSLQQGVDAKSLSLLQQRLHRRVDQHHDLKHRHYFNWQRLAIGMVAAVLFVAVSTLLLIRYLPNGNDEQTFTEVELMDIPQKQVWVSISRDSDGHPLGEWSTFEAYIAKNLTPKDSLPGLEISFEINEQGTPYKIDMNLDPASAEFQKVVEVLVKGGRWTGHKAHLRIQFSGL